MKAFYLLALSGLIFVGCGGGSNTAGHGSDSTATQQPAAKTAQKKEFAKMTAQEAKQKFGFELEEKIHYKGFYHAYNDASGKEVLHGAFSVEPLEDIEAYVAANPEEDEYGTQAARYEYMGESYTGQYVDGVKDGRFTYKFAAHEAGGDAWIQFDAKTNSCVDAEYIGGAEGYCFEYKGKPKTCTFEEMFDNTVDVECN